MLPRLRATPVWLPLLLLLLPLTLRSSATAAPHPPLQWLLEARAAQVAAPPPGTSPRPRPSRPCASPATCAPRAGGRCVEPARGRPPLECLQPAAPQRSKPAASGSLPNARRNQQRQQPAHLRIPRTRVLLHALSRRALAPAAVPRRRQLVGARARALRGLPGLLGRGTGQKRSRWARGAGGHSGGQEAQQAAPLAQGGAAARRRGGGGAAAAAATAAAAPAAGGRAQPWTRAPAPAAPSCAQRRACWSASALEWALKAAALPEADMAALRLAAGCVRRREGSVLRRPEEQGLTAWRQRPAPPRSFSCGGALAALRAAGRRYTWCRQRQG